MKNPENPGQLCAASVIGKKGVLKSFRKIDRVSFLNKVPDLRPAILLKTRLWHRCFPGNLLKFLRTSFLENTSGRLLLYWVVMAHYWILHGEWVYFGSVNFGPKSLSQITLIIDPNWLFIFQRLCLVFMFYQFVQLNNDNIGGYPLFLHFGVLSGSIEVFFFFFIF